MPFPPLGRKVTQRINTNPFYTYVLKSFVYLVTRSIYH